MSAVNSRRQRGFSLAEIMVASAIMIIVVVGVLMLYDRANKVFKTGNEAAELDIERFQLGLMLLKRFEMDRIDREVVAIFQKIFVGERIARFDSQAKPEMIMQHRRR